MSGWTPDTDGFTPEEEDLALAGEYVLGLLPEEERRSFEARLGPEPRLRALVAAWSEDFAEGFEGEVEVTPPPGVEAALMRRLFPEARRPGLGVRLLPWLLGAGLTAVLAFVALNPAILGRGAEPEFEARMASEDESLVVLARFDADTNRLEVERTAGDIPEDRDLELWLVRVADSTTVSLGVLPRDESGIIEINAELAPEVEGNALALSVEPVGGSPTGQATGPVVAVGPVTGL